MAQTVAQSPIRFDRTTGALEGAGAWERLAAWLLIGGSKISHNFAHRGYNSCANLLRRTLPERDIAVALNDDAVFTFPYGDGYWSKLLNRAFQYENELELLFLGAKDVDYTLLDCGANYGYWSVLVSSRPFGAHRAVAIEPASDNYARLARNAAINGGRFRTMRSAVGSARGMARLSGAKHEAFSIAGGADAQGEDVPVTTLDDLLDDGIVAPGEKVLIKLDVEGVEIEAIRGGARLLSGDAVALCEEHGGDRNHTVSRHILGQTPLKLIVHDPATGRFETLSDVSPLDRIKTASHVGYNVFATASPFWLDVIGRLNGAVTRRMQ